MASSSLANPRVCAVMVTGKPGRYGLARMSLLAFLGQDYVYKRMLIINDGDEPVLQRPTDGVSELRPRWHGETKLSLGELRNFALDNMSKDVDYVVQWDDDDYSREKRLSWQVKQQKKTPTHATVFLHEAHCHLQTGASFICQATRRGGGGFPGTIMHPAKTPYRYPAEAKGEDTVFIRAWRQAGKMTVLRNDDPTLYIRFYHGLNTWPEKHVMGRRPGSRDATPTEQRTIRQVRDLYVARLPGLLEQHAVADQVEPGASLQ